MVASSLTWKLPAASRSARLGLLLFGMLAAPTGLADNSQAAIDQVQKLSRAMQDLSYQGRFVYLHNDQIEAMSILHVNDEHGKRERLVSLNGEAREILRDNANLTCVWPSSRQVVVDRINPTDRSPLWIPDDVNRLGKFYQFSMAGSDRIADHPAVVISIQPKDEFRYGMKVWIHEQNGLLLQSHLVDEQGNAIEKIMFTELSLLSPDDPLTFDVAPNLGQGYTLIRSHTGAANHAAQGMHERWQLQSMPLGFYIESKFVKQMPDSSDAIQQMIISDGMASVSVFIEKLAGKQLSGESSMGAINAFTTEYQDYGITAIGEVPAITVKQIANSVYAVN